MSGYKHPPATDIAQIQKLLRDSYDSHSIVKELLQNADDAGATVLHLGSMAETPGSSHPLLRSPAIVALNDGKFTAQNLESIYHLGLGNKSDDVHTIGRFGLGMKSVFHLCEAFFITASPNQPAANGKHLCEILNPSHGTGWHDEWDKDESFISPIVERCEKWQHNTPRWLCLWLPLRQKERLNGVAPIVGNYPGVDSVLEPELPEKLITAMPLLRSVQSVVGWTTAVDHSHRRAFEVSFDSRAQRCKGDALKPGECSSIAGSITCCRDGKPQYGLSFAGEERLLNDLELIQMIGGEEWPSTPTIGEKGIQNKPEKGLPHVAAVFSVLPASTKDGGRLIISPAVFLPLASEWTHALEHGRSHDFHLLLHGCFFLDAGRKEIKDGNDLPGQWNRLLLEKGVYPLILPSLDDFVRQASLKPNQVRSLTEALKGSTLCREQQRHICGEHQWLYCLSEKGGGWRLLKADQPYWEVPSPDHGKHALPGEVLPALLRICGEHAITLQSYPRLTRQLPSRWADDLRWLDGIPATVFSDPEKLDYLNRFVAEEQKRGDLPGKVSSQLAEVARQALAELGMGKVEECADQFKEFLGRLTKDLWVALPDELVESSAEQEFISHACSLGISKLLTPHSLAPERKEGGRLSVADASRIISSLESFPGSGEGMNDKSRAKFAVQILQQTEGDLQLKREACGNRRLFRVQDADRTTLVLSWNQLVEMNGNGELFEDSRSGLPGALRQALRGRQVVLLIEDGVAGHKASPVLFGEGVLGDCNWRACIEVLCGRPALSSPENRADLLGRLLREAPSGAWEGDYRNALRYLLHGSKDHFAESNEMLLIAGDEEDKGLWGRITQRILRHEERDWRCVDGTLAAKLNSEQKTKLSLSPVNAESVEKLLAEADLDSLRDLGLTDNERIEILRSIQDRDLWCRLPLHATTDGAFASLQHEHAYTEKDFPVSPLLAERVVPIRLPQDSHLKALYFDRVPVWTPEVAIRISLEQTKPSDFTSAILDALLHLKNQGAELRTDLQDSLRKTAWLPTRYGPSSPDDVIDLPKLEEELTHLLSEFEGLFVDVQSLDEEVRKHDAFAQVRQWLFPKQSHALTDLGECLKGWQAYAIGDLRPLREDANRLEDFLQAFDGCEVSFLPGYGLLKAVSGKVSKAAARTLCDNLLGDIPVEKIKVCLTALAAHCEEKESCLTVHSWYLDLLVSREDFRPDMLEGLRLPNRRGHWKDSSVLCAGVTGVDDAYLLNETHDGILGEGLSRSGATCLLDSVGLHVTCDSEEEGVEVLKEYFLPWEGHVARELIGGFVALLGNHRDMLKLARDLLGQRDLATLSAQLGWQPHMDPGNPDQEHFVFRVADTEDDEMEIVGNLLGQQLRVTKSKSRHFNDIFMLDLNRKVSLRPREGRRASREDPDVREVVLRKLDPAEFTRDQLFKLLLESSSRFLREVYGHSAPQLQDLWRQLAQCDQYDLETTQAWILEETFSYFLRVHGGRLTRLDDLRREWGNLKKRGIEEKLGHTAGLRQAIPFEAAERNLFEQLQERLESDPEAQAEVWEAVCGKVSEYQYKTSSIPFELFQNADDAVVELAKMVGYDKLPERAHRLKVMWDRHHVRIVHWGRRINLYRLGDFSGEEGQKAGFDCDLYKMLMLSASNKSTEEKSVTGKFGLGFNSVFLFSDRPKVLSGQLGFEVVGGLFPKALSDEDREHLKSLLADCEHDERMEATVIELAAARGVTSDQMLQTFLDAIHVMLLFSRQIKQCLLSAPGLPQETIRWQETAISDTNQVHVGLMQPTKLTGLKSSCALLFRTRGNGAIMLPLADRGIGALEKTLATYWVTAPTNEELDVGLAINGDFAIDPGRARLGGQWERNRDVALAIGNAFGQGLADLASSSFNWNRFRAELRLAPDTTCYEFWKSLWDRMTSTKVHDAFSRGDVGGKLLRLILWSEGCGFARLLGEKGHGVIPSCLGGDDPNNPYRVLTNMRRVQFAATGILDQSAECFARVCDWERFQQKWEPGSIVSTTRVKDDLKRLLEEELPWKEVSVTDVLKWETGEHVHPIDASRLGQLVNPTFMARLRGDKKWQKDAEALKGFCSEVRFQAKDGTFQSPRDFLIVGDNAPSHEERLRAAFAPDGRVLHDDYDVDGVEFFRACRGEMRAPAETLAEWGSDADGDEKRQAFLRYLLQGELANQVGQHLRQSCRDTWLKDAECVDQLEDLDHGHRLILHGTLGHSTPEAPRPVDPSEPLTQPSRKPGDSASALQSIFDWWTQASAVHVQQYENNTYPDATRLFSSITADYGGAPEERKAWLMLFLRAALETMGAFGSDKHLEFLRRCERERWVDELAKSPAEPERLLGMIQNHLDKHIQEVPYYHWVRHFVIMLFIPRWLDDYVESFLSVNRSDVPRSINSILSPRTYSDFSGGGPDAPPLRPVLGIGAHFVLRELVRHEILTNRSIHPLCFEPSASVLRIVLRMGGPDLQGRWMNREHQSRAIHEFLSEHLGEERATFGRSFDIPLRIIDHDPGLWRRFLREPRPEVVEVPEEDE